MTDKIDKDTGIAVDQGKFCGETTKHAHLGNTGSCLCGLKKYPVKKEADLNNLPPCDWCDQPPSIHSIQTQEVYCATEGCPAFSNVVSKERWIQRRPHAMETMWIPTEEPIFVLRGQDKLAQAPAWDWVNIAEKYKVVEHKIDSATERIGQMVKYEREVKSKMPD